jgi:hypothetical protein
MSRTRGLLGSVRRLSVGSLTVARSSVHLNFAITIAILKAPKIFRSELEVPRGKLAYSIEKVDDSKVERLARGMASALRKGLQYANDH